MTLKLFAALTLITALLAGAAGVQAARERAYPTPLVDEETLAITSGTAMRRLSLGYTSLTADLYWIRALQYYGGTKKQNNPQFPAWLPPRALSADPAVDYPLLYPLLDLTTTLDPRFNLAYRFGAVFLAEPYPGGPGRPDLAVALLEKGLRERPDKWEYMEDIGFVHYWYRHDYQTAAAWFDKASGVSGAPWWLRALSATTLAKGGDRRSSRQMWSAIRESAEIDWLRQDAERHLLQFRALDELEALQKRFDDFAARTGHVVTNWPELARAGVVPGIMVDPSGAPYQIAADGRVRLSPSSPLSPLPEEPQTSRARPSS